MVPDELRIAVQPLAPGVWRCAAPNAMCSSVIFAGDRAVLVADSMVAPGLARQVKEAVQDLTGKPVRYLLNTHGDSDHILGNQEFWPDSVLLSHRLTRERLLGEGDRAVQMAMAARPFLASELERTHVVVPEAAFASDLEIDLGGLLVQCIHVGPAHTAGDVVVWAPERRAVFVADVIFNRIFPVTRNADMDGWLRALGRIEGLRPDVVAVGHGEVGGPGLIGEMRDLLTTVRDGVLDAVNRGLDLERALREVRFPAYEHLARAEERIPQAIQRIYSERPRR